VILNSVDLESLLPRSPLPEKPSRALVFSNGASESTYLGAVREACNRTDITLDVIGADSGNVSTRPQDVLGQYDIVFAKARCALEALAVGNAVVLCDWVGCGPMVTTGDIERLRRLNFGVRAIQEPVTAEILEREIARYNAHDAAQVSRSIRASAGREPVIEQIVELYYDVVREFESSDRDLNGEARAEARYLRQLSRHYESERDSILNSRTFRWRRQVLKSRIAGSVLRLFAKR
jgi:hypothetical protein